MLNDEMVWMCLETSCSFKYIKKDPPATWCTNKYNVVGECRRHLCPLANAQYATVLEDEGNSYLYMKTVERAHSPKNLWERVKLSKNFLTALEQINRELEYWPDQMINNCKARMTKIRQMLIRMRKLAKREGPKLVPVKQKTERRERVRELKAEKAAKVDLAIERELLERLKQGTYGDIYNFAKPEQQKEEEKEDEVESEAEFVEDYDSDDDYNEEDDIDIGKREEVELDMSHIEDLESLNDTVAGAVRPRKKRRQGPRVEVEYEQEVDAA